MLNDHGPPSTFVALYQSQILMIDYISQFMEITLNYVQEKIKPANFHLVVHLICLHNAFVPKNSFQIAPLKLRIMEVELKIFLER
jgi:hypothetical protein